MVGWLRSSIAGMSQAHSSPDSVEATSDTMRRRTGSASAFKMPANSVASASLRGDATNELQHRDVSGDPGMPTTMSLGEIGGKGRLLFGGEFDLTRELVEVGADGNWGPAIQGKRQVLDGREAVIVHLGFLVGGVDL